MRVIDPGKIRRKRKNKHFTQRELAYLTNCSQSAIYLIEAGKLRNISENLACLIAARLDEDVEDLFEAHEEPVVPEPPHASPVSNRGSVRRGAGGRQADDPLLLA